MNGLSATSSQGTIAQQGMTDDSLYRQFINYLDAKPKTIESYRKNLKSFFKWLLDNNISRPTFEDVKAYRDYLLTHNKPTTVTAYIFTVRRFFSWTEQAGLYPDVAGKIKGAVIGKDPKKDYLSSGQIKIVIKAIDTNSIQGKRDQAIVSLMAAGGLRDIEVSRANVGDLRISGNHTVLFLQGKGRDERNEFVIVPEKVESKIRAYLQARGKVNDTDPLFASLSNNSKGNRMTTRSVSAIAKGAMCKAGFSSDRLTAHSFRHSAITLALMNGATVQEVQQFARHKSINTTMIYAHNLEKQNNKCSRLVADSIFEGD